MGLCLTRLSNVDESGTGLSSFIRPQMVKVSGLNSCTFCWYEVLIPIVACSVDLVYCNSLMTFLIQGFHYLFLCDVKEVYGLSLWVWASSYFDIASKKGCMG